MAVADHQPPSGLVTYLSERRDVGLDLGLQGRGQHPPGALAHDLIQAWRRLRPGRFVNDYPQHWRRSHRRWPAGIPICDHLGRYAAPSIGSGIHNFES
jgi:hypothetical protein